MKRVYRFHSYSFPGDPIYWANVYMEAIYTEIEGNLDKYKCELDTTFDSSVTYIPLPNQESSIATPDQMRIAVRPFEAFFLSVKLNPLKSGDSISPGYDPSRVIAVLDKYYADVSGEAIKKYEEMVKEEEKKGSIIR